MEPSTEQPGARSGPSVAHRETGAQVVGLAAFLAASALVAWLGTLATLNNVNGWYVSADKAPWTPPNWVFGPVWTALYIAMAIAAWLVWRRGTGITGRPLKLYWAQLALNLAWTPLFFGLYPVLGSLALWLALAVIVALAIALAFTVMNFGPVSPAAGILLLPYLSWVIFAGTLNIWAAINN